MLNQKEYMRNYYIKNRSVSNETAMENFLELINQNDPSLLCPKGFTKSSKISAIATTRLLNKKWFELIEEQDKLNSLYEYVKSEFLKYYNTTGSSNVHALSTSHPFISQDVLKYFGHNKIKTDCGFTRKGLYNKLELKKYFLELTCKLGFVPTYSEFIKESKEIRIHQFYSLFSNDNKWETVVKNIVSNQEYEKYINRVNERNSEIARIGKQSQGMMSEVEMKNEFCRVFDLTFEKYGVYPTRRLFNELSSLTDGAYRKRYKESWNKTVVRYGYPIKNLNPSEKYVLGVISELTGVKYQSQMKWEWLVSKKGNKLPVDGFYKDLNLVVEFDGSQHRRPVVNMGGLEKFKSQIENDLIRDIEIPKHGIKLIRIGSNEKWYVKECLMNKLIEHNIPILTPTN